MSTRKTLEAKLKSELPSLIDKIKSGDASSKEDFAILVFPYVKRVLIDRINKEGRHEVMSEIPSMAGWITTKVLRSVDRIDIKNSIVGYIATTAVNYYIDVYYKSSMKFRSNTHSQLDLDLLPSNIGDPLNPSIDFFISGDEEQDILLYYMDGLSIEEIEAKTGASISLIEEVIETTNDYF